MSFSESLDDVVHRNRNQLLGCHPTWERVRLHDVAEVLNGFPFASERFHPSSPGTPLIRIRDILRNATETYFRGGYSSEFMVRPGDLLVGMDGDFNSAVWRGAPGLLNQRCCKISIVSDTYDLRLLAYCLPGYLSAINARTSSITVKHLSSRTISDIPLPLPPLAEQRRIADTLDELFSELDAGVAALERARAKLKLYRASVLKAAVEGALTAEWRAQHPDVEPASTLLQRILVERRRRWEAAQLAKYEAAGKTPPKNWKAKYREPVAPDTTHLPSLPDRWCWASIDSLIVGGPTNGAYYPATSYGSGHRILRIDDFQNGWVRATSELRQVAAPQKDVGVYGLSPGDLVINRVNSMTHLGKCLTVSQQLAGCLFESNMMRVSLSGLFDRAYVQTYLHSPVGRARLIQNAKWAVNQASINQEDVRQTAIPIPPDAEQAAIVDAVEEQLSVIDHLEADLDAKLKGAQALRQSILRDAFAGRLVPQDPNDEPASVLLERIAAERAGRDRRMVGAKGKRRAKSAKPAPTTRGFAREETPLPSGEGQG